MIDFGLCNKVCCNCGDVIKCDSPTYFYFVRSCFCKNTTGLSGVVGRMAELAQLVQLLQQQITAQQKSMETQQQQHLEAQQQQREEGRKQMEALITTFTTMTDKREQHTSISQQIAIPNFVPFDSTTELWTDYWARFQTFIGAKWESRHKCSSRTSRASTASC